ncbi:MAG TPA: cation:proton antiporter [Anaerolineae bacterium]|mgnify:CR=1 FL=1|nr:cation:proton antiporter [Anaerolineae bacterium]HMR64831.1 cation:proton antiporter [Anaerolineae bacterium]
MSVTETITLNNLELTRIFFAIVLLLISAHFFGYLFHRFKLPRVIGEIFGGLLLGPTGLGFIFPEAHNWIFNAFEAEGKLLSIIYWFGLVLLMFISGFELQKSIDRQDRKLISITLLGATVLPFLAGWLAPSFYDFSPYLGSKSNMPALTLIIAIAVAVTSIPVISKIFLDLNIIDTRFAKIILATATIQDVILWVALAIATGLVSTQSLSLSKITGTVIITIGFFGLALFVMPKLIKFSSRLRYNLLIKSSASGYVLLVCFLFSAVASILEINIVFGAFLAGIVIGVIPQEQFGKEKTHIREISLAFFIPLYFAIVGLKLDLIRHFDVLFFLGFLLFSTAFESLGTLVALKLTRNDWLSSFNIAVAMNTRGGPGIVLATVAFDLGIINQTFFATLVLIAIVTSLLAGYWFRFVTLRGWPLLNSGRLETLTLPSQQRRELSPAKTPLMQDNHP